MATKRVKFRSGSFLLSAVMAFAISCSASEPAAKDFKKALGEVYSVTNISNGITDGDENAAKLCQGFTMSEKGIRAFLNKAKPIDDVQIHNEFDWAPCFVRAKLTHAKYSATLEIRASGLGLLTMENGATTKLGCAAECDGILLEKSMPNQ